MFLKFFDVTHGFCAYLKADNGNIILFDCGHNELTGFRPSNYLRAVGCNGVEKFVIQNFDQDHVSDLPNLLSMFPVACLVRNRSISPEQLRTLKQESGTITPAMEIALGMHGDYVYPVNNPPEFPGLSFNTFWNPYPAFTDTNNLSLVSFLEYDGMGIILSGDLEKAGWEALLENPSFRSHLARVNIFVASHHGRNGGYCESVFDYCKPDIIIISDKEVVHDTQINCYKKHASGLIWNGGPGRRFVLTTRSDGTITVEKILGRGYHVSTGG